MIKVTVRSKAYVCIRSIAWIEVSIPAGGMKVCLFSLLYIVRYRSLREDDHLSRAVLLGVCVCVSNYLISRAVVPTGRGSLADPQPVPRE